MCCTDRSGVEKPPHTFTLPHYDRSRYVNSSISNSLPIPPKYVTEHIEITRPQLRSNMAIVIQSSLNRCCLSVELNFSMTRRSIAIFGWLSAMSICLSPYQLLAETLKVSVNSTPAAYEDDKIKITAQDCSRKLQDLVCQATFISKNADRAIYLNGGNIRLVDFEGNEYRPSSIKLANIVSENNLVGTELVENVPFKAVFVFGKVATTVNKFALLQIPLGGGLSGTAKFRNVDVVDANPPKSTKTATTTSPKTGTTSADLSTNDLALICPDNTKILYRAASKSYLMYICGGKNPTHYVGLAKDGSQGITLRLRYYDRTRFSADNGAVIYQEKIQVLQSLPVNTTVEATPAKVQPKKTPAVETTPPKVQPKKTPAVVEPKPLNKKSPSAVGSSTGTSTTPSKIKRRVQTNEEN
jgi:hypothetical protein